MRKLYPESAGPVGDIPRTGPAPVLLRREVWEKVRQRVHTQSVAGLALELPHVRTTLQLHLLGAVLAMRASPRASSKLCF